MNVFVLHKSLLLSVFVCLVFVVVVCFFIFFFFFFFLQNSCRYKNMLFYFADIKLNLHIYQIY